jgi:hypothetical protein
MKKFAITIISAGAMAAAAVGLAGTAAADDQILPKAGDEPADVTIQQLQSDGYTVSINWLDGYPNVPLGECKVTGISGLGGSTQPAEFETAYVDVACPNAK